MRLVLNIPRRPPLKLHFWEMEIMRAALSGKPTTIVASSREQAERTYVAAKCLINGRDPKGAVPG